MTIEEAREIIKNAQPIVMPTSATTTLDKPSKITSFKDFLECQRQRKQKLQQRKKQS